MTEEQAIDVMAHAHIHGMTGLMGCLPNDLYRVVLDRVHEIQGSRPDSQVAAEAFRTLTGEWPS